MNALCACTPTIHLTTEAQISTTVESDSNEIAQFVVAIVVIVSLSFISIFSIGMPEGDRENIISISINTNQIQINEYARVRAGSHVRTLLHVCLLLIYVCGPQIKCQYMSKCVVWFADGIPKKTRT